jgi:CarD family transcriptional regulator
MFKKGDKVVYPAHGIGVIDDVEQKMVVGKKRLFYVIKILENGVTVMTPVDNVDKVGLRGLSDKKEISRALKTLRKEVELSLNENWNRRQKGYFNKIKTGSLFEVAEVYRDLYLLQLEKELSFGERKMLDNARFLIVSEIAEAKGIELKKAEKLVEKAVC